MAISSDSSNPGSENLSATALQKTHDSDLSSSSPSAVPMNSLEVSRALDIVRRLRTHFTQEVIGQETLRESLITTMVAGGHLLIESVPGLAKTTAAQTLARSVSGSFKRIQCTPDLMPSDLVGTQIFDFASQKLVTHIGPIHANFVLLDEINRSSAKTQSAMLEAMAEGATTIGGQRIALPAPFMVIATQNPIEEEGTYNLPEAQMDRFTMKAVMKYPSATEEENVLRLVAQRGTDTPGEELHKLVSLEEVDFIRAASRRVHVSEQVMKYAVSLVATTRGAGPKPLSGLARLVRLGASPRASISLLRVGQATALINGRDYVTPEDLKVFAHNILRHRILLTFEALADAVSSDDIVDQVLQVVPVP